MLVGYTELQKVYTELYCVWKIHITSINQISTTLYMLGRLSSKIVLHKAQTKSYTDNHNSLIAFRGYCSLFSNSDFLQSLQKLMF